MQSPVASAAGLGFTAYRARLCCVSELGSAAYQSSALLLRKARLCCFAQLSSVAVQSSALLPFKAQLCCLSQLSSAAFQSSALLPFTAQLCCFSQLSSAAFHSSALLYLHSMVMLEACKAESWMILQDIYILSLLTWLLMLMITLMATQICPQQLTM